MLNILTDWCYSGHFSKSQPFFRAHTEVNVKNGVVKNFIGLKQATPVHPPLYKLLQVYYSSKLAQMKDNSKIHQKKVLLLLESPDFSFDGFEISRFA